MSRINGRYLVYFSSIDRNYWYKTAKTVSSKRNSCSNQSSRSFTTQVEEMYKKNQGHGICGSKNLYSSNVKLGNWVEDKIGLQLTQQELPVYKNYMSNTNLSYQDPKDQPPLPSMPVNMPTTQELKAKNKEGMQYSLIFDHGLKEIPPEVT